MFQTTRWSLVLETRQSSEAGRLALEALCRAYRSPVVAYLRARGLPPSDAEDLAQSFFEQLLRRRLHATADPGRGRFRAFLLTSLKHFLANEHQRACAARRGGNAAPLPLEPDFEAPDQAAMSPDAVFERDYALTVVARAMDRLRVEAERAGKSALFAQLEPFLLEPPDPADYAALCAHLDMRRNTLAVTIHRLRNRLRETVRAELRETVDDPATLEHEVEALGRALARRPGPAAVA
ncbi:RNA polymerase sigma factor [Pseudoxanthomonas taiwanensis]|mgnify:FL=1|jgi:DNA-directed RNA polymerase specialized sigma subunit, sigma24 homolog|nr:sigma-70 family RNA polymerase sigma factor [Pseudoxanthomonas taiwanensis]